MGHNTENFSLQRVHTLKTSAFWLLLSTTLKYPLHGLGYAARLKRSSPAEQRSTLGEDSLSLSVRTGK